MTDAKRLDFFKRTAAPGSLAELAVAEIKRCVEEIERLRRKTLGNGEGPDGARAARLGPYVENGKCPTCRGTGRVLAHRPTIYCTDSDEEIALAYEMASRPCRDCPDFQAILACLKGKKA